MHIIGVDLGGTWIKIGLINQKGRILDKIIIGVGSPGTIDRNKNQSKVILSGGIGKSINTFIPKISKIANQHTMKSMRNTYKIVISTIFEDAGILGAGSLAMEEHQAN